MIVNFKTFPNWSFIKIPEKNQQNRMLKSRATNDIIYQPETKTSFATSFA